MGPVDDTALREDIRELGEILGEVIREHWGEHLFRLEEDVRLASRRTRTVTGDPGQDDVLEGLEAASIADALSLVRAFTVYFHLPNTAVDFA